MATATQSVHIQELDTKKRSSTSRHFEDVLRQRSSGRMKPCKRLSSYIRCSALGCTPQVVPSETCCFWDRPAPARRALSRPQQKFCLETAERWSKWIVRSSSTPMRSPN